MITFLHQLWRLRWLRVVGGASVFLLATVVAFRAHSAARYRAGYASGVTTEREAAASREAIASAIADSAWRVLFARSVAQADSLRVAREAADRQAARRARAEQQLAVAQAQYAAAAASDSGSEALPLRQACDALASACEASRAASAAERDSLTGIIQRQGRVIMVRDSVIAQEPERARRQIAQALATAQAASRPPSRLTYFVAGVVGGLLCQRWCTR